jgi:S1-C subfamily serine protease
VSAVDPAGPAAAGLFPGLVIDRFNGHAIRTEAELRAAVAALHPGEVVSVVGRRPDGSNTIVNFRSRA